MAFVSAVTVMVSERILRVRVRVSAVIAVNVD